MANPNGTCGGLDEFLDKLAKDKKIGRMMGPDEKGNRNLELPAFFERRGLRFFAIDSGLGRVGCRVPRIQVKPVGENRDIPEEQMVPLILASLTTLPDSWCGEETFALKCGVEVKDGERLPAPQAVVQATAKRSADYTDADALADQRDYLNCLPKSLADQVFVGLGYMTFAPLPMDPLPAT